MLCHGAVTAHISLRHHDGPPKGKAWRFRLRHRYDKTLRLDIDLQPGSLLLMTGATQTNYRHDLPRTARAVGPRINLTFRRIFANARSGQQHAGHAR